MWRPKNSRKFAPFADDLISAFPCSSSAEASARPNIGEYADAVERVPTGLGVILL